MCGGPLFFPAWMGILHTVALTVLVGSVLGLLLCSGRQNRGSGCLDRVPEGIQPPPELQLSSSTPHLEQRLSEMQMEDRNASSIPQAQLGLSKQAEAKGLW